MLGFHYLQSCELFTILLKISILTTLFIIIEIFSMNCGLYNL